MPSSLWYGWHLRLRLKRNNLCAKDFEMTHATRQSQTGILASEFILGLFPIHFSGQVYFMTQLKDD